MEPMSVMNKLYRSRSWSYTMFWCDRIPTFGGKISALFRNSYTTDMIKLFTEETNKEVKPKSFTDWWWSWQLMIVMVCSKKRQKDVIYMKGLWKEDMS